ncbi:MAG: hypothetical protein UIJ87_01730 [Anaerovoracaceae bacterium]|nr:hypothetical protein [Anaerovoracaceae bacterium]
MFSLSELSRKYKTISIVGMAKNAGKTTALNYLIEEAMDEGLVLGVTSTGRDGESTDIVTGTDKPRVFLDTDTIVSVPTQLYELADAGLEILKMTEYGSSIGQIMLCRVVSSGYVQVAGPVINASHRKMCEEMLQLGAQLVLIDGAIDRKSIAAPGTSDAIILSTGAVLSRSMKKVIEETAHTVGLYRLPCLEDGRDKDNIYNHLGKEKLMIAGGGEIRELDLTTGLGAGKYLDSIIDENTEYIYVPGAFTGSVVSDIAPKKLKDITFVLKDPTRIFIDSVSWGQLRKKGLKVKVLENINVAAITVNPSAPGGYAFEHEELLRGMQEAIADIPVIDVML